MKKPIGNIKAAAVALGIAGTASLVTMSVIPDDVKIIEKTGTGSIIELTIPEEQYQIIKNFYVSKMEGREILTPDEWRTSVEIINYEIKKRGGFHKTYIEGKTKKEILSELLDFISN